MRLERIVLIVLKMIFKKNMRAKTHAVHFSFRQPLFFVLPACVDMRKINLGLGVLPQDSMIVMTLNLTGWHLEVGRCVRNTILWIVRNEN